MSNSLLSSEVCSELFPNTLLVPAQTAQYTVVEYFNATLLATNCIPRKLTSHAYPN